MNHIPLLSLLLGADTAPYDAPACFELAGRHFDWSIPGSGGGTLSFDGSTLTIDGKSRPCACIKCEEAVYLLKADRDALLIRTDSSAAILAAGCAALHQTGTPVYDGALCGGWMDARFMPGRTIRLVFGSDTVSIDLRLRKPTITRTIIIMFFHTAYLTVFVSVGYAVPVFWVVNRHSSYGKIIILTRFHDCFPFHFVNIISFLY